MSKKQLDDLLHDAAAELMDDFPSLATAVAEARIRLMVETMTEYPGDKSESEV